MRVKGKGEGVGRMGRGEKMGKNKGKDKIR